jgi:hypothetical protein
MPVHEKLDFWEEKPPKFKVNKTHWESIQEFFKSIYDAIFGSNTKQRKQDKVKNNFYKGQFGFKDGEFLLGGEGIRKKYLRSRKKKYTSLKNKV